MRRLLSVLVPSLLIAALVGYWFYGAGVVRRGLDDWIAEQEAEGTSVEIGQRSIGGFPLEFRGDVRSFALRRPDGAAWRGAGISAGAPIWNWNRISFRLDGEQLVTLPRIGATAGAGQGDLRLAGGRLAEGRIALGSLAVALPPPAAGALAVTALDLAVAQPAADGGGAGAVAAPPPARLSGEARGIVLPEMPLPALGPAIDHVGIGLAVTGPLPARLTPVPLAAWRDAGGTLQVEWLSLLWGPLSVEATGTLQLDQTLQPRGTLTARIRGFNETVEAAVAAGLLQPPQAALVRGALAALAGPPGPDGAATVTAPLSLANGRLSVGPFPLLRVPPVVWPAGS